MITCRDVENIDILSPTDVVTGTNITISTISTIWFEVKFGVWANYKGRKKNYMYLNKTENAFQIFDRDFGWRFKASKLLLKFKVIQKLIAANSF